MRQHEANKFTCELPLLFTVLSVVCDSFVILAHSVVSCQQLFLFFQKLFSAFRGSHESYNGLWLSVVSFVVFCRFDDFAILTELWVFGKYFFTFLLFFY